ncbi:hypothetical protein WELLINGTON_100 [Erwinia phage Wellington]|uniref:Uncharacterized protein n=2 Tax=Wellingtonvirus wellington TaxID=2734153 RepID=A0A1B2IDW1_9CAUD|nr:hypothetical protein BIZ80_gp200 [Erwinia phage vB_EamM_Kwan]YP_009806584.1 hypothetical protein HOT70_gp201 [Erwinia phage Wellington]ANZ49451.1 hypothetical protein KWAN_99 [Erwinia phage vB_EamM_Kwan]AXF51230.1 hypothetical protein WELLINGTON_100 [Erwinia phage Wellington]
MKKAQWRGKRHAYEQFQLKQIQRVWVDFVGGDFHEDTPAEQILSNVGIRLVKSADVKLCSDQHIGNK